MTTSYASLKTTYNRWQHSARSRTTASEISLSRFVLLQCDSETIENTGAIITRDQHLRSLVIPPVVVVTV